MRDMDNPDDASGYWTTPQHSSASETGSESKRAKSGSRGALMIAVGRNWVTRQEAARRVRVRTQTIDTWRRRGKVTSITDEAKCIWVDFDEVCACEKAWRDRIRRVG